MDTYQLMPHASMGVYVCCDANTTNGSMLGHYLTSGELKQKLKALVGCSSLCFCDSIQSGIKCFHTPLLTS